MRAEDVLKESLKIRTPNGEPIGENLDREVQKMKLKVRALTPSARVSLNLHPDDDPDNQAQHSMALRQGCAYAREDFLLFRCHVPPHLRSPLRYSTSVRTSAIIYHA